MFKAIERLKAAGLKVALLTNVGFKDDSRTQTDTPLATDIFDVVVESCTVCMRKPHPDIFLVSC